MNLAERIERNVEKIPMSGCWIWTGAIKSHEYGSITVDKKSVSAHRASWVAFNGEIPNGLWVLHRCDVQSCVNPKHLFLGTNSDNIQDSYDKGRSIAHNSLKESCIRGHPLSGENLYVRPADGGRMCRTCARARGLKWLHARRPK